MRQFSIGRLYRDDDVVPIRQNALQTTKDTYLNYSLFFLYWDPYVSIDTAK